jgi:pyrroloquinoline quinone biosynthesis protein D
VTDSAAIARPAIANPNQLPIACRPQLQVGVRLHHDRLRGRHVLLYPEGVLVLNRTATDVLLLCNGRRDIRQIIESLASSFSESSDLLMNDVTDLLARLVECQLLLLPQPEET